MNTPVPFKPIEFDEVHFIALPPVHTLENAGMTSAQADKYKRAQWAIRRAQENCAVVAAEILRPKDIEPAKWERDRTIQDARAKYRQHCLDVFSEKCTKGM